MAKTIQLKEGQHVEDVYILSPRERDTIIAALRVWQDRGIQKVLNDWNRSDALQDIATNCGLHDEPLDETEIDILIEDNLNVEDRGITVVGQPDIELSGYQSAGKFVGSPNMHHLKVTSGECPVCRHFGSDCTGYTPTKPRLVIEVNGGIVQEVYSDLNDVDIVLVDWDNINAGDEPEAYVEAGLKDMPEETREQVEITLAK